MRTVLFFWGLLLAFAAVAESEVDVRVNRIEMSVTAPEEGDDAKSSDQGKSTKAQDYNSSRSNNTNGEAPVDDVDSDDDSIDEDTCNGVDDDCDGVTDAPANHNTTRSNR